jgi:CubicO group peptidase (beta-lactamase class C family)
MLRCFFLLPLLLHASFFNWFETLPPKAQRAKELLETIDPMVEKAIKDFQVPGMAIGVVVDGHVVYAKGFGYRDIEKKLPMTPETLFAVGSCTKAFTTFAMGNLVDEGMLHWDQPVIDVLPEFRLWDQYATTNLTIRDLITHRTGMPRHEFVWYNAKMNKQEMLRRIRYLKPSFEIRQRYQYGNLMYFVAGMALERLAGKSWEEFIQERILNPLQMKSTNFSVEETQKSANYASPYIEKEEKLKKIPFRNLSLIGPAGCLNSNVEDLTHWIKMHLAGGVYEGKTLISPATLQELHAAHVIVPGAPESRDTLLYAYGLGWAVHSYRGHYYLSHDGVSDGFTSVLGLIPNENIGIVILSNKNMNTLPRYLSMDLIDRLLSLPPRDWLKEGLESLRKNRECKTKEDKQKKSETCPCHPMEDYVGVYEHPGYGKLTVELVDGKLQANYNDLIFVLGHWNYDIFKVIQEKQDMIVSFEGTKFSFCNNANGEIGELVVPFEPTSDDIVFKRRPTERHSTLNYLRQFTGVYEFYGYTVEIALRDQALIAIIPGQPNYDLVPAGENEFSVKSMTGSTVRFVMRDDRVEEVLLIHPYGAFTATPKR